MFKYFFISSGTDGDCDPITSETQLVEIRHGLQGVCRLPPALENTMFTMSNFAKMTTALHAVVSVLAWGSMIFPFYNAYVYNKYKRHIKEVNADILCGEVDKTPVKFVDLRRTAGFKVGYFHESRSQKKFQWWCCSGRKP